jgi:predicted CopG family antitoxin
MEKINKTRKTFSMSIDIYEWLKKEAEKDSRSVSSFLEKILRKIKK